MLEAVNSVLQTAPFVRGNSDQISTVDSYAANPDRVQHAAPQAPYVSPYIYVDVNYDKAVIQLRNGDTGDVEDQFPSEAALQAAARQAAKRQVSSETQRTTQQQQTAAPQKTQAQTQAPQQTSAPDNASAPAQQQAKVAITAQQQAAFQAAAQSGNSNAGSVTVFA